MSLWQQEYSVEQMVARSLGDEDWDQLENFHVNDDGCKRAPTSEADRSGRIEPEPISWKQH